MWHSCVVKTLGPRLPGELGVGFTDAGMVPGNDANKYGRAVMKTWRDDLYARLRGHLCRVARRNEIELDGEDEDAAVAAAAEGFGPTVVAFAGKRQYGQLFDRVPGGASHSFKATRVEPSASRIHVDVLYWCTLPFII